MTGTADPFLEDYLQKYDAWIAEGKVPHAARILPIGQSIASRPWVLPSDQAIGILHQARTLAVWPCVCRSHYRRCDHPVEVCLILDQPAEVMIGRGQARPITLAQAADLLRETEARGLVHMGLYYPGHGLSAICSCCTCCCHELQIVQQTGRLDRLAHADYLAFTDLDACTHCGACADRCPFGARLLEGGRLVCRDEACLGCGLCVATCPPGAIRLQARAAVT